MEAKAATYNKRSPAVKRILQEMSQLQRDSSPDFVARPLEDNLFEWHFTIRGPKDTPFKGGRYHGRILLPTNYPYKPPSIIMLTPNGRFEVNKEICLSFTDYHPEEWQPAWGIRTALMALIGFLPSQGKGAIGALDYTDEERRALARQSRDWVCEVCGMKNSALLKDDEAVRGQARERASSDSGADLLPRIQFNYEGGDRGQPVPDRASGSLDANASSNIVIQEGHSYVRANRGNPDQHGGGLPIITDAPEVHRAIATDRPRPLEERTQQGEDGGSHPHPNATTKRLDAIICALIAIIAFLILRRVP